MRIWTISAQEGTSGASIAAALARAADVELLDRDALLQVARRLGGDIGDMSGLEERLASRLGVAALSVAISSGSSEAAREHRLRSVLPELGRTVVHEVAHRSCVILSPGAFAALRDHPSAVHVRLRAPLAWRVDAYRRAHVVSRQAAERAVKHDDRVQQTWVKTLYHVAIDDPRLFTLVLDASRLAPDRVVETLLAAGGVARGAPEARV